MKVKKTSIEKVLQELQISKETFTKVTCEISDTLLDEKLPIYVSSWENFYSKVFRGKTPAEKRAIIFALILLVIEAMNTLLEVRYFPHRFSEKCRKLSSEDNPLVLPVYVAGSIICGKKTGRAGGKTLQRP